MKQKMEGATRNFVLDFVAEKYNTFPEQLWTSFPNYSVLRHSNGKWYGVIMDVPKEKLGLAGKEKVDVIDVKCDFLEQGFLLGLKGVLPAYHMNKSKWVTILLDGSVDKNIILEAIEMSYKNLTKK